MHVQAHQPQFREFSSHADADARVDVPSRTAPTGAAPTPGHAPQRSLRAHFSEICARSGPSFHSGMTEMQRMPRLDLADECYVSDTRAGRLAATVTPGATVTDAAVTSERAEHGGFTRRRVRIDGDASSSSSRSHRILSERIAAHSSGDDRFASTLRRPRLARRA
jgi:hypothetical protein